MKLRVQGFRVWLPIFLILWPLLLLASPVVLLVALVSRWPLRVMGLSYQMLCALRGLDIDIQQADNDVQIKFI